jgi:exopolysaccharide production protein ExoZ
MALPTPTEWMQEDPAAADCSDRMSTDTHLRPPIVQNGVPPPAESSSGESRLESLQVLRGLAATLVVWCHAEALIAQAAPARPTLLNTASALGAFGVDIFFVISGAVMMITSQNSFGRGGARSAFLRRRIARIYPPYWFYSLAMCAFPIASGKLISPRYLLESLLLLPVLNPAGKLRPILGVGWTLSYELYFYLLFALVLGVTRRWAPLALGLLLSGVTLLASLVLDGHHAWGMFLSDPIAFEFLAGVLIGAWSSKLRELPRWLGPALVLLGFSWWTCSWEPARAERWLVWGAPAVAVVLGTLAAEKTGAWRKVPRGLIALGDSSYSLYLLHPGLFAMLAVVAKRGRWLNDLPTEMAVALAATVALAVAYPAHVMVERPLIGAMRRLLFRFAQRGTPLEQPSDHRVAIETVGNARAAEQNSR